MPCPTHGFDQLEPLGEAHTIRALVGDDVILSVDTLMSSDIRDCEVDWSRADLTPDIVHLQENRLTSYEDQHPLYKERTMLSAKDLKRGIISLKLPRVQFLDEGNYTCRFNSEDNKNTVQLLVGAASSPVITLEDYTSSGPVLACRANGWYPEPKLSWWNADGLPLPAINTTTTNDSNRHWDIFSTVQVERRSLSRPVTCRVHQEQFNQTMETEWHPRENLFEHLDRSYQIAYALMTSAVLFFVGALLIVYRIGRRKPQKRKDWMECHLEDF